ncbi:MAG TPA: hypothetical protein VFG84_05185 [Gemmatimonadaceae bacterium]|nr:hypothetical protein [Gemmatimonadaceae bacterium]
MGRYETDDEPMVVIERNGTGVGPFLAGIALGAVVALLVAPGSGAETRRELRRGARRARRAADHLAGDVRERVNDGYGQARGTVERRIDTARQAIDLKKKQVSAAMQAGREAAQQARADLERRIAETRAAYEAGADVARNARAEMARAVPVADIDEDDLS